MDGGSALEASPDPGTTDFSERAVEEFFRRWYLYLVPIVVFGALGVQAASTVPTQYLAGGTLNASSNPLVDAPEARGTEISVFESPSAGVTRLVNEQLQTDAFVDEVARRAELTDSIESGAITRHDIRTNVRAGASGQNLMYVQATWNDPDIAFALVDSTISGYLDYVADIVASDSIEAVAYWTEQFDEAAERADDAEAALASYMSTLEPGVPLESRSVEEQLSIRRLEIRFESALEDLAQAQDGIDTAGLSGIQAQSDAGQQLRLVDPPSVPTAPESRRMDQLVRGGTFILIGLFTSIATLLVVTATDRSIRTRDQLTRATGIGLVVAVPSGRGRSFAKN